MGTVCSEAASGRAGMALLWDTLRPLSQRGGPSLCDGVGVASCSLRGSTPRGSESERPCPRAGGASVRQGHCGRPRKSHQGSLGAESSPCKGTGVGRQSDVCGEQSKEGPKGRGVVEAG